jgi:PBP1b-binding outer membrane lipoprotein LpoB
MKKSKIRMIISIGISVFLLSGCGAKNVTDTNQTQSQGQTSKEEKQIKLDKGNAINLSCKKDDDYKSVYNLFEKQEIKAKEQYLSKTLKISGEVGDIEKKNGYIIVSIMTESHSYDADLYFKDNKENETKIGTLKKWDKTSGALISGKGDVITVYGIFEEFAKWTNGNNYIKVTKCEFI